MKTGSLWVLAEEVSHLGSSKRPPVHVTIIDHTSRSPIASLSGVFILPISTENRLLAQMSAGDEVEIDPDMKPREGSVPPDFEQALARDTDARRFFDGLSSSNKQRVVLSIEGASTTETRLRRIAKAGEPLREGKL